MQLDLDQDDYLLIFDEKLDNPIGDIIGEFFLLFSNDLYLGLLISGDLDPLIFAGILRNYYFTSCKFYLFCISCGLSLTYNLKAY